jgi:hypothetical protein
LFQIAIQSITNKVETIMKGKLIFLSALGAAGGLLYVLESQHRRIKSAQANNNRNRETVVGNGRAASAKQDGSQLAASMARIQPGEASIRDEGKHVIDDQGTDQSEASQILRRIRDNAFDANDEKLALALGRPTEEIEAWTSGRGLIDGDVILKARTLAMQRGFEI